MFCFQKSFSRRRQAPLPPVENASDIPHRDVPQANIRKSHRNISYPGRNNPFCGASHYKRFAFLRRKRIAYQPVGVLHQPTDECVGYVAAEIDIAPHPLIHVPCRTHALVPRTQFRGLLGRRLDAAAVEEHDIDVTEPLAPDIKTEHVAAVSVVQCGKRHLLGHTRQRQAILPELLDIHRVFGFRFHFRQIYEIFQTAAHTRIPKISSPPASPKKLPPGNVRINLHCPRLFVSLTSS